MKIMIIGNGAREHALAWKLRESPKVDELYAAPGNAGTASIAHNLDVPATDIEALARAATGLSQATFAKLLGVSVRTLQEWEQGRKAPSGAAVTLLKVAARHPEVLQDIPA